LAPVYAKLELEEDAFGFMKFGALDRGTPFCGKFALH
jgi:hypothetical protein